jgi:hypothetical protein
MVSAEEIIKSRRTFLAFRRVGMLADQPQPAHAATFPIGSISIVDRSRENGPPAPKKYAVLLFPRIVPMT